MLLEMDDEALIMLNFSMGSLVHIHGLKEKFQS
jgi:hypothetical protein